MKRSIPTKTTRTMKFLVTKTGQGVLILTLGMHTFFSPSPALGDIMPGLPDALVCSVKDPTGTLPWEKLVYYVSASMNDGRTLYKTLTSDPVVLLVSAEGIIEGRNLADCDGKSVEALREDGRAFTLTRPVP